MDFFTKALNNEMASKIFAILCLIIIELSTAISITKLFKFVLIKHWGQAILSGLIVLTIFSISFISSTNGLAYRQAAKVDNTIFIANKHISNVQSIKQEFDQKTKAVEKLIELERQNPQGWKGKNRSALLQDQLERIEKYNALIADLNDRESAQFIKLDEAKREELTKIKPLPATEPRNFKI